MYLIKFFVTVSIIICGFASSSLASERISFGNGGEHRLMAFVSLSFDGTARKSERYHIDFGARFDTRLPFNTGLVSTSPMSMYQAKGSYLSLAEFRFSENGNRKLSLVGLPIISSHRILRINEESNKSANKFIYIGGGLLAAAGLLALLASEATPSPDFCIAIFPPPPGCP